MIDTNSEILYICQNNKKDLILQEVSKQNKLYNIKFMSLEEFKDEYFYRYNTNIYPYMMEKYSISFSSSKEYLNNMYQIDINKTYKSSKIEYLKNIKIDLIKNNLLIFNKNFKNYLKHKKIIVTYDLIEPYLKQTLDSFHASYLKEEFKPKSLTVLQYNDIEEEVNNTILKIIELVKNGVSLNNIYLTNIDSEYYYILKKLFKLYNIPLDLNEQVSLNTVLFTKEYFVTKKIPEVTLENKNIVTAFTNLLNKYVDIETSPYYKQIIKEELKHTYVPKIKHQESIRVVDFGKLEVTASDYVFLLGFNEGILPRLVKDEDYFSDLDKKELGLLESTTKNNLLRENTLNKITNIKNLTMSYKLHGFSEEYYPSSMIEDYDIKIIVEKHNSFTNSNSYNKRQAAILLDNYNKYKIVDKNLTVLLNNYELPYNTYNHKFSGISKTSYLEYIPKPLKLSYTNMNAYNLCPFSYYIKYVLKIDPFEDTFQAFIGNLYHQLFSLCFTDNFDFEKSFDKYLENRILTPKENFLLKRLNQELQTIINVLKEQKMYTDFKDAYYEKELQIPLNNYSCDVIFKGIIDKIMYYKVMNDTYYAVVDYKTGQHPTSLNNMKYGLDMQLATYIYLIEKSNLFENPIFTGCYFQKTSLGSLNKTKNKTIEDLIFDKLKLRGYSTADELVLGHFDHLYTESKIISGMSVGEKGFGRYAKTLDSTTITNLINYTDNIIKTSTSNILEANFAIAPKVIDGKEKACMYCKYKDLCFKDINDNIELEKVNDLSFLGGEESGKLD